MAQRHVSPSDFQRCRRRGGDRALLGTPPENGRVTPQENDATMWLGAVSYTMRSISSDRGNLNPCATVPAKYVHKCPAIVKVFTGRAHNDAIRDTTHIRSRRHLVTNQFTSPITFSTNSTQGTSYGFMARHVQVSSRNNSMPRNLLAGFPLLTPVPRSPESLIRSL